MSSPAVEGISVVVDQNQYLAEGADTVDAVVTVESGAQFAVAAPARERVEIIIIDCSGSMAAGDRFAGARAATLAALDEMPDGTLFAIVKGTHRISFTTSKLFPGPPGTEYLRCQRRPRQVLRRGTICPRTRARSGARACRTRAGRRA